MTDAGPGSFIVKHLPYVMAPLSRDACSLLLTRHVHRWRMLCDFLPACTTRNDGACARVQYSGYPARTSTIGAYETLLPVRCSRQRRKRSTQAPSRPRRCSLDAQILDALRRLHSRYLEYDLPPLTNHKASPFKFRFLAFPRAREPLRRFFLAKPTPRA